MESNKRSGSADMETVILALHQLAEEVKDINKAMVNVVSTVNLLSEKTSGLEEKLQSFNIKDPTIDTKEIQQILTKGMLNTSIIVERQLKDSSGKFQILLFPPQDAKLFYKIVFGRWFLYAVIGLAILKFYDWGVHKSNNEMKAMIELESLRTNKIVKAWQYLYDQKNKNLRRQMDSALIKYGR